MAIVLQETLRGLLYTPFYLALSLEAYKEENLEIQFTSSPRPADAARGLLEGTVDVSWGGPLRVMETYERFPSCDLVCFCEVITRDPFFLVGRTPRPNFQLIDLKGMQIATVSEVPTPWLCLQQDLRDLGIDPNTVERVPDRTMSENVAALRRGEIEMIQLFEPFVEEVLEDASGHIWYAAADRGPTSYTTFYTTRQLLTRRKTEAMGLVRAIYRTQKWIATASAERIAREIRSYFPDEPETRLAAAINRYKYVGIWGKNPRLPRIGYERLKKSIISGGFVRLGTPYEQAVDNSFAEAIIKEDPPAIVR
jgi:NitT/TauT family transport system substrate-binding protein